MSQQQSVAEFSRSSWSGRGSLQQLVAELDRQKNATFDFVTDTRNLAVACRDGTAYLQPSQTAERRITEWIDNDGMPISDSAISQLGGRMSPAVPVRFLRSLMSDRPEIAESLLSKLLLATGSKNLVRCLDGRVRAFLSDAYQPLDNYTIAFQALEVARRHGAEIIEASLSESKMRVKFTTRSVFDALNEIRQGDRGGWYAGGLGNQEYLARVAAKTRGDLPGGPGTIHPLVTIGNSETGHGSLFVRAGILQAACFNLATVEDVIVKIHLGSRLDPGIFRQETIRKEAEAVMMKASDSISTAFDEDRFKAIVAKVNAANSVVIEPTKAVDFAISQNVVSEQDRDRLLIHFLGDSAAGLVGHTAYAFAQGVSRLAQDTDDSDYASDLEEFAGKIISQPSLVAAK